MVKFIAGAIIGVAALIAAVYCYARFGFVDPRGDVKPGPVETGIAEPALSASLSRYAPKLNDPVQADPSDLLAGMNLYQGHCAGCHGDPAHPTAKMADSFAPPPPQFLKHAPDMPPNQDFYVIEHGIRWSGMPAWDHILDKNQMWQVTTFLNRIAHLPPEIAIKWKAAAAAPSAH